MSCDLVAAGATYTMTGVTCAPRNSEIRPVQPAGGHGQLTRAPPDVTGAHPSRRLIPGDQSAADRLHFESESRFSNIMQRILAHSDNTYLINRLLYCITNIVIAVPENASRKYY